MGHDESETLGESWSVGGYLLHLYCCMCAEADLGSYPGQTYKECRDEARKAGWSLPASRANLMQPWSVLCPACSPISAADLISVKKAVLTANDQAELFSEPIFTRVSRKYPETSSRFLAQMRDRFSYLKG